MKKIHLLPTDKPSKLFIWMDTLLKINIEATNQGSNQNIYITSDEEIKRNDYWINVDNNTISNGEMFELANDAPSCKKIILTTDQDLIKDGVQAIDDEFLEWFVQNPSCEKVDVWINKFYGNKKEMLFNVYGKYKIIIPKEEPKNVKGGDDIVFPEREVKFEDVFNDEKKEGLKQFIQDYKEKPWRDFEVEYNAFINSGGLNGETGEGWINHSKLIPWLKENYIITKKN